MYRNVNYYIIKPIKDVTVLAKLILKLPDFMKFVNMAELDLDTLSSMLLYHLRLYHSP